MSELFTRYQSLRDDYPHTYFAGANTADGFIGAYADRIRETELTRLCIIKGGSGTGKSSLIRTCAAKAAQAGASVTMLLCSSDPTSADAVILHGGNGRRIAILDGTAPHTADPALPGAVSEIVNVGAYWDADVLRARREEIALFCARKAAAYTRAYRYMGAYRHIADVRHRLMADCVRHDKLQNAASRLAASLPTDKAGAEETFFTYALSMTGAYHLTTFTDCAMREYRVMDYYGSGDFFFDALRNAMRERRMSVSVSPSLPCRDRIGEMFVPAASAVITRGEERSENPAVTSVNMQRFLDRSQLSLCRGRLRFAERCLASLLDGALQALADASAAHFALEEIYKSAMDFDALADARTRLADEIAAELI